MVAESPSLSIAQIRRLADDLAQSLWPLWQGWPTLRQFKLRDEAPLAGMLVPAIAAFAGRLMTLTPSPEQLAQLPAALGVFFADPDTAAALDRYAAGQSEATDELLERLLAAGLNGGLPLRVYFGVALDTLLAAVEASLWREPPGPSLEQGEETPPPPTLFGDVSPYLYADVKRFVVAYYDGGLGRLELGRALAANGATVIYEWEPAPMAGESPGELAESAGPEEGWASAEPDEPLESIGDLAAESGGGAGGEEPPAPPAIVEPLPPPPPPPSRPAPKPLTPEPTAPAETLVPLRLDAALPARVVVGRAFDLAVAVRRPESPPLAPDDLARRESAGFEAAWPAAAAFIRLRLQVAAPECDILGGDSRDVRLPAGGDGPPVYFQLTPHRAGPLSVVITVYQATDWAGSTRLRTEAGDEEPRGALAMTVASAPLADAATQLVALRRALDDGYNDSELRDLCFELGIDYEELSGDNQSAKARELVLYAQRHNLTAKLVEHVMRDRPHLLIAG